MATPGRPAGRHWLRLLAGPLLVYHALILIGAYLLVVGILQGPVAYEYVGATLIAGGVVVELTILVWTAGLVRGSVGASRAEEAPTGDDRERRGCARCGWSGENRGSVCPRCGGPTYREYSAPSPPADS
jgi:hypothetical protein